jgi:hypothetical protein
MKVLRWSVVAVAAIIAALADASARAEDASASEILELLKVNGTEEAVRPLAAQILESARRSAEAAAKATGRPADQERLERVSVAFDPEKLLAIVGGVYARHFNKQEVQDLLGFYRSPTGRKLALSQVAISLEMQEAIQGWVRAQSLSAEKP